MASINGDETNNVLNGTDEADLIQAFGGADEVRAAGGDDTVDAGLGADGVAGDAGADLLQGDLGADVLLGGSGADTLDGGDDNDSLTHDGGSLVGFESFVPSATPGGPSQRTVVYGGDGILNEDGAVDVLNGGAGDDRVVVGLGDIADGGAGEDGLFVLMNGASAGLNIDLSVNGQAVLSAAAGGSFTNFERLSIHGGRFSDQLTGDAGANILVGGAASDTLRGGEGSDTLLHGENYDSNGVINSDVEDGAADLLEGGGGDDRLTVGLGDSADGGVGVDHLFVTFAARSTALNLDLSGGAAAAVGAASGGVFSSIERVSVIATSAADRVVGDGEGQNLYGMDGADSLDGGGGNDLVSGEAGDDLVRGGGGNDLVYDGAGADLVYGDEGDDFINLGQSAFIGGAAGVGDDTAFGGDGHDRINSEGGRDLLVGGAGRDVINGGDGDDVIHAHVQPVGLIAFDRDTDRDTDTINAGGGDDLIFSYVGDVVNGGAGADHAVVNLARSTIAQNLDLGVAGTGTLALAGGAGSYTSIESFSFFGGTGGDTLAGGSGADELIGEQGDDVLNGGGGDDYLSGTLGVDRYDGGDGFDRLSLFSYYATSGASADLRTGVIANDGFGNVEQMQNIESLGGGTRFTDTFYGDDNANFFVLVTGESDQDVVQGFGGDDEIQLAGAAATVDGGAGVDSISRFTRERVVDANGDGVGESVFTGAGVHADLGSGRILNDGYGRGGALISIENLGGSDGDDTLTGDSGANWLWGHGGKDNLWGGAGADSLEGGAGDDFLQGAEGDDLIDGGAGGMDTAGFMLPAGTAGQLSVVEAGPGLLHVVRTDGAVSETVFEVTLGAEITVRGVGPAAHLGTDVVRGIEQLNFWVNNGPNPATQFTSIALVQQTFGDFVAGGVLNDVIDLAQHPQGGNATVAINANGNGGDDRVIGHAGANNLQGGSGADTLQGAGGDDYLAGGLGDDRLDGGAGGNDVASYIFPAGTPGQFEMAEGPGGSLLVRRVDGANVETVFQITLSADGAVITGLGSAAHFGTDTVTGVESFHIFVDAWPNPATQFIAVDLTPRTYGDFVSGSVLNDVIDLGTHASGGNSAIQLNANGNGGDDLVLGHQGPNNLHGGAGADTLRGLGGDDYLTGDAGQDTVDGGAGWDVASFRLPATLSGALRTVDGVGADAGKLLVQRVDGATVETVYVVTIEGSTATVQGVNSAAAGGVDTVVGVEDLHFLFENAGSDPTRFTSIPLAARQYGVFVAGGEGADLIDFGQFPGAETANGNRGDDTILGGAANNHLTGGAGNDFIDGRGGSDFAAFQLPAGTVGLLRVVQGAGDGKLLVQRVDGAVVEDLFHVTVNNGVATVQGVNSAAFLGTDTVVNVETLQFSVINGSQYVPIQLTALQNGGEVRGTELNDVIDLAAYPGAQVVNANGGADVVYGNADPNTLRGGDGADSLYGAGGSDFLQGQNGNDRLDGGEGADNLQGLAGDDTIYGGEGDDILRGGRGVDAFFGGAGFDRVSFFETEATQGVVVDLRTQQILNDGFGNVEALNSIEALGAGTTFADTFYGNDEANLIFGGGGDVIYGFGGADNFFFGDGAAVLDGGDGVDTIDGFNRSRDIRNASGLVVSETTTAGVQVNLAAQSLVNDGWGGSGVIRNIENVGGSSAGDILIGDTGANSLWGLDGADRLEGAAGADTLEGGLGNDTLDGGGDVDLVRFSGPRSAYSFSETAAGVTITGPDGTDLLIGVEQLQFTDGTVQFRSLTGGPDIFSGGASGEVVFGRDGADGLTGAGGGDLLDGGAGSDALRGQAGDDTLRGGAGDDFLQGGQGDDRYEGGDGLDRAAFSGEATSGVRVSLALQGVAQDTGQGFDTLSGIEHLSGTIYGDVLTGDDGANWIVAGQTPATGSADDTIDGAGGADLIEVGAGSHVLQGGEGVDTLSFYGNFNGTRAEGIKASLALQGAAQDTRQGSVLVNGFENLAGSAHKDDLAGDGGANLLAGGADSDLLSGGGGDDTLLGDGHVAVDTGGFGNAGPIVTFEDVNLVFTGQAGLSGADTLRGGDGADSLFGGRGDDSLDGGAGVDTARYTGTRASYVISEANGVITVAGPDGVDSLVGVERLQFSDQIFELKIGGEGPDALVGGAGDDFMIAGGGADVVQGGGGRDAINSGDGNDLIFHNLTDNPSGVGFNHVYRGSADDNAADLINAGAGDDEIIVGAGDTVDGGEGSDWVGFSFLGRTTGVAVTVGDASPTAAFAAALGVTALNVEDGEFIGSNHADTVVGGAGSDQAFGMGGDDLLLGGGGQDVLVGGGGSDTVRGGDGGDLIAGADNARADNFLYEGWTDGGQPDVLEGEGGDDNVRASRNDVASGGDGFDMLYVSFADSAAAANLDLTSNIEGALLGALNITATGFERYGVVGSGFNDLFWLDASNNVVFTEAGDDYAEGGAGADILNGQGGADTLLGGLGADRLYGHAGNDVIRGGDDADTIADQGYILSGSPAGVPGGDDLFDGEAGDDTVSGGAGADTLLGGFGADVLNGGIGNDLLDGGEGADTAVFAGLRASYAISEANGVVTVTGADGVDRLTNVETLQFGDGAISLRVGTAANDVINGSAADELFFGGAGADNMRGTAGADTLNGGEGDDLLRGGQGVDVFQGGDGFDRVSFYELQATEGAVVDLRTQTIVNDGFGNTEQMNSIEGLGAGTVFADTFHGDENGNLILGGGGDYVYGHGGSDNFFFGDGPALLDGGDGVDTLDGFNRTRAYRAADGSVVVDDPTTLGVHIDLSSQRLVNDGWGGTGVIRNVENVGGSGAGDILIGDDAANLLWGFDGDDRLEGGGGADTLDAGEGTDTVSGGASADLVVVTKASGSTAISLGHGEDRVVFGAAHSTTASTVISDFVGGTGGDVLSLSTWLSAKGVTAADPFASGHLRLLQEGQDTLLQFDADGGGNSFSNLAVLANFNATALTTANLDGLAPRVTLAANPAGGQIEVGYGSTVTEVVGGAGIDVVSITAPADVAMGVIQEGDVLKLDLDGDGDGDITLTGVEDLILNGERVIISGNFDGTGLSRDTIRVGGTADGDLVDGSGLLSPHSIVAISGAGADTLIGGLGDDTLDGGADNDRLSGGAEADRLIGGGGNDTLAGGDGRDWLTGGEGDDVFVFGSEATRVQTKAGALWIEIITDFDAAGDDRIDLSALDAFKFVGASSGKGFGEVSFNSYGSINAAESVLGIDLDGVPGQGAAGPVTIVWGNTDGDKDYEFAIVLLGEKGVAADDFLLNPTGIV